MITIEDKGRNVSASESELFTKHIKEHWFLKTFRKFNGDLSITTLRNLMKGTIAIKAKYIPVVNHMINLCEDLEKIENKHFDN